eukprot:GFUD01026836.1.p1 GENE.GFUD01026836.1~~GFUD01026836.1.p1  ORF type:complete len:286 (+),score=70.08 GFUD01026836.1:166-1023(+)
MEGNEENFSRQQEEIEALSSIYEDCFILDSETCFTILIKESCGEVLFTVSLPPNYPSAAPPTYQKSAPFLRGREKQELCNLLDEIYVENLGECVVFLWVEQIRTFLQERNDTIGDSADLVDTDGNVDVVLEENSLATALHNSNLDNCPKITTGTTIEDRKSVFQGHTASVKSAEDVKLVLSKLYENKKVAHATHNMYAYRIFSEEKQTWLCDCDDDGEDAAGGRMLHLLEILEAVNTLVVVSRWYGGTHLGPDRFKHINNAARQVLEIAGVILPKEEKGKKKRGK